MERGDDTARSTLWGPSAACTSILYQGLQGSHLNLSQTSAQRDTRYFLLNNKAVNFRPAVFRPKLVIPRHRGRPQRAAHRIHRMAPPAKEILSWQDLVRSGRLSRAQDREDPAAPHLRKVRVKHLVPQQTAYTGLE